MTPPAGGLRVVLSEGTMGHRSRFFPGLLTAILAAAPAAGQLPKPTPRAFDPPEKRVAPTRTPTPTPRAVQVGGGGSATAAPVVVTHRFRTGDARISPEAVKVQLPGTKPCDAKWEPMLDSNSARLDCLGKPAGRKMDVFYLEGKPLKPGWRVKSASVVWFDPSYGPPGCGKREDRLPGAGATDPSAKVHMWAEPGRDCRIEYQLKLEGPPGGTPF